MKLSKCKIQSSHSFGQAQKKQQGPRSCKLCSIHFKQFDPFISNEIMRPVVLQQKSVFNFRQIMDDKKILLVNLSKGRLGDINANLIGLVLVGKLQWLRSHA